MDAEVSEAEFQQEGDGSNEVKKFLVEAIDFSEDQKRKILAKVDTMYQEECERCRQRAERFHVEFKPPDMWALFKSEMKKERALIKNGGREFYSGLDPESAEELSRAKQRIERFGPTEKYKEREEEREELVRRQQRSERFGPVQVVTPSIFRELKLDPNTLYRKDPDRVDPRGEEFDPKVSNKIHVSCLDKQLFIQFRSPDILRFFDGFAPKFVEWLGSTSCNVLFADTITVKRALRILSTEAPALSSVVDKPTDKHVDLNEYGWKIGSKPIEKIRTDAFGTKGTAVRVLLRVATENDKMKEEDRLKAEEKKKRKRGEDAMDVDEEEGQGSKNKRKVIIERATTVEMPDAAPAPAVTTEASEETSADKQDPAAMNGEGEEVKSVEAHDDDIIL